MRDYVYLIKRYLKVRYLNNEQHTMTDILHSIGKTW